MYDVYKIREQFPMLSKDIKMQNKPLVFLDNCSTTFKPQCVIDAITEYYTKYNSNSHRGDYDLSYQVDVMIEETRKEVATLVNAEEKEVVFTDGATASLNLVAYGYGLKHLKRVMKSLSALQNTLLMFFLGLESPNSQVRLLSTWILKTVDYYQKTSKRS